LTAVPPAAYAPTVAPAFRAGRPTGSSRLRTTFIVTIVAAYCAVGALTVAAFLLSARSLTLVFATRFARTEALLEKNRILARIDREVALAAKLADDPVVRRWAVSENDPGLRALALEQLESFRGHFTDHSYFIAPLASRHYFIHDSGAGSALQVTTLDPRNPADAWYFDTLRTVDTFALNVDYDRLIQSTKVWINAVMRDARGIKIGICGTGIDISDFLKNVLQSEDANAAAILVDRGGAIEAHPNASYVLRNAEVKDLPKLTIYDLLGGKSEREALSTAISDLAIGRVDVASLPLTVEGRRYLAAVSAMPSINWFNLVLVDTSRVLRFRNFLPLAATIVVSLLLVLLAVALLLNRLVLRPLSALAAASREIAVGRYGVQLALTRSDEIGQLTSAFNAMSTTVKDTTEGLETRVEERTRELTLANHALEESQGLIMESLAYARRLQAGILPGAATLSAAFPGHFVLYLPRDMVSGDFYFVRAFDGHTVAAVIDCMGHGVPGAFMTMTVHAVLSHVLDAVCSDDPARIVAELDRELRDTLHRHESDRRLDAGLDISVCVHVPARDEVLVAGAGLSVFAWDGAAVREVRGDSRRVGYRSPGSGSAWVTRRVPAGPQTALYLCTDGFLDQAGGAKGFGFGRERFGALVGQGARLSMGGQETAFREALAAHQGTYAQRDDITVLAFRAEGRAGK
jgi:sigma-B regulation protein RsbU (phosphoserine phosphatase)